MPRCGHSQERSSDQTPSIVLTCTSQEPSPSSSRAYSPRPYRDLDVEVGLFDYPSWPDRPHNGVFGDQLARLVDQNAQQIDCPRAQFDWNGRAVFVKPEQEAAPAIEAKTREKQHVSRSIPVHGRLQPSWHDPSLMTAYYAYARRQILSTMRAP